ncbi:MAG: hypothetical protein AB1540_00630 [Bdellovibrionota bacterium]
MGFFNQKEQVRDASGESQGPLFDQWAVAPRIAVAREIAPVFAAGIFSSYEYGKHRECGYVSSSISPSACSSTRYHQYFLGPTGRVKWKALFLDLSYIAFGIRSDSRSDEIAGSKGLLWVHPLRAWLFHPGMWIDLSESMAMSLRIEYRFLYFDRTSSGKLPQAVQFGTQSIRPVFGIHLSL